MTKVVELAIKKYPRFAERRVGFIGGYDQAKKDTIERAIKWLNENIYKYEVEPMGEYNRLALLEDFKEEMEKEE